MLISSNLKLCVRLTWPLLFLIHPKILFPYIIYTIKFREFAKGPNCLTFLQLDKIFSGDQWLITRENFIESCRRESFRSYILAVGLCTQNAPHHLPRKRSLTSHLMCYTLETRMCHFWK